jgi:hypothetical protein
VVRDAPQLSRLRAVGPSQTPLLRKQKSVKSTHRNAITFIPGKLSPTQRKINQKSILNKSIKRDMIHGARPRTLGPPLVRESGSIEVATHAHPVPGYRLNTSRQRVPQPLLRPSITWAIDICHVEFLSRGKKLAMTPKNMVSAYRRPHLYLRSVPNCQNAPRRPHRRSKGKGMRRITLQGRTKEVITNS